MKRTSMRLTISALVLGIATTALSGCAGIQSPDDAAPSTIALSGLQGKVFGGQQPIAGATVQIYQAGTTGYGAGAIGLISGGGVTTDSGGGFTITGLYSCTSGSQVYLAATGGNPGAGVNTSSALLAGLGLCDNLSASTYISINEVTTVATVWALSPFMNDLSIGAPATNQAGLVSAFADINTLVNSASGDSPGPADTNASVPVNEIYALANILAACINSTGAGGGGACDELFSYTTFNGIVPADTVAAAVSMARHPAQNVNGLLFLPSASAPFPSTFSSANDLTLAVTYTVLGLSSPTSMAVDASGNVWIANAGNNSVTKLSHAGTVLSGSSGFTAGVLNVPSAIAIDTAGDAWMANAGNSTLTELSASGASIGSSPYSGGGLSTPTAIAFDGIGNVWVANSGNNSVSEFSATGTALSPANTGYANNSVSAPVGVAINPH